MREMLDHHHFVYYKPSAGSLGHGIYRLTYLPKKDILPATARVEKRTSALHYL